MSLEIIHFCAMVILSVRWILVFLEDITFYFFLIGSDSDKSVEPKQTQVFEVKRKVNLLSGVAFIIGRMIGNKSNFI